ncbi:MAG: lipopolysaccharide heptosyltransferase I [Gammaproteobacteria bacterium]
MRVLIIKTSSMGDVIHTLPALTDAGRVFPSIRFDWIVEENFAEIPRWHPLVDKVIPVAIRRWRKNIFSLQTIRELRQLRNTLRHEKYDLILDAQGLFKSAWLTLLAKGPRCGMNRRSARESLAALFYQRTYPINWDHHAIKRVRSLFSQVLGIALPTTVPDYGIDRARFQNELSVEKYLVFLHGTTWDTKHWPEEYWLQLANKASEKGYAIKLPWGNSSEKIRAERIAANCPSAEVLPRSGLVEIANILAGAKAIVAVDTGLGHLAAALNVPTISLYGPTDAELTGALGESQVHLSAKFSCAPCFSRKCTYRDDQSLYTVLPPCFTTLPPSYVWTVLEPLL